MIDPHINKNTTDPLSYGIALYDALTESPKEMMNPEAIASWFAYFKKAVERKLENG